MVSRKSARVLKDKTISFRTSATLTVVVGTEPNKESFLVHEGIICAHSEFFRRAMNGNWIEGEDRLVKLPEDDPEIFAIYSNHIYTNNIATNPSGEAKTVDVIVNEYLVLSKLYVLAEKLCDIATKNATLEAMLTALPERTVDGKNYGPRVNVVATLYDGTPHGSAGRRLMVQLYTNATTEYMLRCSGELPKEFLADLATALIKTQRKSGIRNHTGEIEQYLEKVH